MMNGIWAGGEVMGQKEEAEEACLGGQCRARPGNLMDLGFMRA